MDWNVFIITAIVTFVIIFVVSFTIKKKKIKSK